MLYCIFQCIVWTSKVLLGLPKFRLHAAIYWFESHPWNGQMTSHGSSFNLEDFKTKMGSNGAPRPTQDLAHKLHPQNHPISEVFGASNDRPYDGTVLHRSWLSKYAARETLGGGGGGLFFGTLTSFVRVLVDVGCGIVWLPMSSLWRTVWRRGRLQQAIPQAKKKSYKVYRWCAARHVAG